MHTPQRPLPLPHTCWWARCGSSMSHLGGDYGGGHHTCSVDAVHRSKPHTHILMLSIRLTHLRWACYPPAMHTPSPRHPHAMPRCPHRACTWEPGCAACPVTYPRPGRTGHVHLHEDGMGLCAITGNATGIAIPRVHKCHTHGVHVQQAYTLRADITSIHMV